MAAVNTPFLNVFPKVDYKFRIGNTTVTEKATDIFFRLGMLRDVINNAAAYYVYEVKDGETPDALAFKIYGDAGVGWIIMLANQIEDPQFDWPLDYHSFDRYIINKYGSLDNAKSSIHHFEKVVEMYNSTTGETSVYRYTVSPEKLTENLLEVPFNYYYSYNIKYDNTADTDSVSVDTIKLRVDIDRDYNLKRGALPTTPIYEVFNMGDASNTTIHMTTSRNEVTFYDFENDLNEKKRQIKIINPVYYKQIVNELDEKTLEGGGAGVADYTSYVRRLR